MPCTSLDRDTAHPPFCPASGSKILLELFFQNTSEITTGSRNSLHALAFLGASQGIEIQNQIDPSFSEVLFFSHVNAETPGSIHEGGELGYALGVAFGAVMDNPDLVLACVVGNGEAETGPTATAWHAFKYIDPAESGAVLPILHVNGFKISERTIFGTMDDKEIVSLFT